MKLFNRTLFRDRNQHIIEPPKDLLNNSSDLVQHLYQVVFSIDATGHWIFLNDAWVILTGFSIQDSLNKNVLEHIHPEDRNLCNQSFISLVNNERASVHIKARFITKDGGFFWANIIANNYNNNLPIIIGSFSDISDEVHEKELALATHRSLSSLVNNLSGLIYRGRNDREWSMEYVSAGCYALTGYKAEELINKSVTFASLIHPDDREKVWNEVQLALDDWMPFELIYRIKTISGEEKWIWERGQGNFSSNGEMLSLQGHMTDITSWKKDYLRTLNDTLYVGDTEFTRRHLFIDRLKLTITRSKLVSDFNYALLMIQADRLNRVMSGFSEDDRQDIRSQISNLLSEVTLPLDTLCMINDDKFAILAENIESLNDITNLTKRIHNKLSCHLKFKDSNLFITVSIGIATNSPHYDDHNHLIKDADTALIRAKVLGGGRDEIFDPNLNSKLSLSNRMEMEISSAIEDNKITVLYQPIISSRNDHIAGLQASLVWDHPRKGQILLKAYLHTDSEKQLTGRLNQHLLTTLCDQIINWESFFQSAPPLFLILDFFDTPDLKKEFIEQLEELLIKKTRNKITYYLLLTDEENSTFPKEKSDLLQRLCSNNNVSICIEFDELGKFISNTIKRTESDMVMLKNPVNSDNPEQYSIFKSMIEFIHTHDIPVAISYVDTEADVDSIRRLNPDFLQGSFFSKPVDSRAINSILSDPKLPWLKLNLDQ